MIAFILGAGLGTRLRPLTESRPKPLIPVCNRPLIEYAFDHLQGIGVRAFVVNTHWLADKYTELYPSGEYGGVPIHFRHEPEILETAGGIKNVEDLLKDRPFIVYNGDIFTDLPLAPAVAAHRARGNEVTLILRSKDGPLQVALDEASSDIVDIGGRAGSGIRSRYLFTGIYLVQPEFLRRLTPGEKTSVIPIFLKMIQEGAKLGGIVIDSGQWWDLGSREQYLAAHQHLARQQGGAPWIDPTAQIAENATVTGCSAVGQNVTIGSGATIHDCLLWPGTEVAAGAQLRGCIATGGRRVEGEHSGADL